MWANASAVPCNVGGTQGCCAVPFSFRFGATDYYVFQQARAQSCTTGSSSSSSSKGGCARRRPPCRHRLNYPQPSPMHARRSSETTSCGRSTTSSPRARSPSTSWMRASPEWSGKGALYDSRTSARVSACKAGPPSSRSLPLPLPQAPTPASPPRSSSCSSPRPPWSAWSPIPPTSRRSSATRRGALYCNYWGRAAAAPPCHCQAPPAAHSAQPARRRHTTPAAYHAPLQPCRFSKVHAVNAGLWGRSANITMASGGKLGQEWGKVFREAAPGEDGVPAYSVDVSLPSLIELLCLLALLGRQGPTRWT